MTLVLRFVLCTVIQREVQGLRHSLKCYDMGACACGLQYRRDSWVGREGWLPRGAEIFM